MKNMSRAILTYLLCGFAVLSVVLIHVEKGFAEEVVTPLVAARNGLQTADAMIAQGKLDKGWAADLHSVSISIRNIKGFSEYVITLTRSSGTPSQMAIYINMKGGYSGSSLQPGSGAGAQESGY